MRIITPFILLLSLITPSRMISCGSSSQDCNEHWPGARCTRGKCRCPSNTIFSTSDSMQWVCLSIIDLSTGDIGSDLVCPFPEGTGYRTVLRNASSPLFCDTKYGTFTCPKGYECIRKLSSSKVPDGICCPNRDSICSNPIFDHDDGTMMRFGFDGTSCVQFTWNPERSSTSNNFRTKEQCEHFCLKNFRERHVFV